MKSAKITNLSFCLALGIVWQHSRLPWIPETAFHPSFLIAMQMTNKMMEVIVPCFFFISGFLFYRNYTPDDYLRKLRTRIRSLLVPYLLWNAVFALLWYVTIRLWPEYVSDHFPFDGIWDVISGILSCQYTVLWYVGVIFVYALLAPLIWYMVCRKKVYACILPLLCVVCVVFRHPFCSPILWLPLYTAGACAGVHCKEFLFREQPLWITLLSIALYPVIFYWDLHWPSALSMNAVQWIGPSLCIGLYDLANRLTRIPSLHVFKYSFCLYAMHYMPLHIGQRMCLMQWPHPLASYAAYFAVPAVTVLLVLLISGWMDRHAHSLYSCFSGGR